MFLQPKLCLHRHHPQDLVNASGTLFYQAFDADGGYELFRNDGTGPETTLVRDIYEGNPSSNPTNMVASGSSLFLTATDATHGSRLFVNTPILPGGLEARTAAATPAVADGGIAASLASLAGLDRGKIASRLLTRNR